MPLRSTIRRVPRPHGIGKRPHPTPDQSSSCPGLPHTNVHQKTSGILGYGNLLSPFPAQHSRHPRAALQRLEEQAQNSCLGQGPRAGF